MPFNSIANLLADKGYAMYIPFEGNNYYPGGTGEDAWTGFFTVGYIELQPGVEPDRLAGPVKKLLKLNSPETIYKNLEVILKPMDSYYLDANNGAIAKTLSILSLVALCILLLAVINFVNIMIGTSSYRIKEIGLRKVFGGRRAELVFQYLIESMVLTLFAAILSVVFYGLFRPVFNEILHTSLPTLNEFHLKELIFLSGVVIIVDIMAGIYPAVILRGSEVVPFCKRKTGVVEKGLWMRKSLLPASVYNCDRCFYLLHGDFQTGQILFRYRPWL